MKVSVFQDNLTLADHHQRGATQLHALKDVVLGGLKHTCGVIRCLEESSLQQHKTENVLYKVSYAKLTLRGPRREEEGLKCSTLSLNLTLSQILCHSSPCSLLLSAWHVQTLALSQPGPDALWYHCLSHLLPLCSFTFLSAVFPPLPFRV